MAGEVDFIQVAKTVFPDDREAYYLGLNILCISVPIIVSMYYVIDEVYTIIKDKPAYDVGNFRTFVRNAYYIITAALIFNLVNLLYTLRKGPEKGDAKNMGFWFTMSMLFLFAALGARLSILISIIYITLSNNIINIRPSEFVYIQKKVTYLTTASVITFLLSLFAFIMINTPQLIDIGLELANKGELAAKEI
jgi:hypothetical protein